VFAAYLVHDGDTILDAKPNPELFSFRVIRANGAG
jgi:hypothetical protein